MTATSSSLIKFWRLTWLDRFLLIESVAWLAVGSLAVAILPFRHVALMACKPTKGQSRPETETGAIVNRVRWAIGAAAARVPWRAVCFQQGLAAHYMLRRRGVQSVIHYGAALSPNEELTAHVWVRAGDLDVIGCEVASKYALLTTFPAAEEQRSAPTPP